MTFADSRNDTVPVQLPNGAIVKIEVAQSGREDVGFEVKSFKGVTDAIEGVAEAVTDSLQKIAPNKASVKFGLEIEIEQGSLVAAIVKGTGKANLEITLEWERSA
jgi:uncharacterized membrane protein